MRITPPAAASVPVAWREPGSAESRLSRARIGAVEPDWTDTDRRRVKQAMRKNFPSGRLELWPTSTNRAWAGTARGIKVPDTRIPIKNNAEYHGLEMHAWQYMATVQYELASDYFYLAAAWREEDSEIIGVVDASHRTAEAMCLRVARYARALHEAKRHWPSPESFGLRESWVEERETRALEQLDAFFKQR